MASGKFHHLPDLLPFQENGGNTSSYVVRLTETPEHGWALGEDLGLAPGSLGPVMLLEQGGHRVAERI